MNNLSKLKTYFDKFYENKSATFDVGYSARPELFLSNLCKKPIDTFFLNVNRYIIKFIKIKEYIY